MRNGEFKDQLCLMAVFWAATAVFSGAQTYSTVASFTGQNGGLPEGIIQGFDGNFYGTTSIGGKHGENNVTPGDGTIFRITPTNVLVSLYSFCDVKGCTDGAAPGATLTQAEDGSFFGTTGNGGSFLNCGSGCGTVFSAQGDRLTTLYQFCAQGPETTCPDGAYPNSPLVQARDGNFYGTTPNGGSANCPLGCGTIFGITSEGALTTLYTFCETMEDSICPDGQAPISGLSLGTDGNLYGTTAQGGRDKHLGCLLFGCGTIFRITPEGTFTTLYNFCADSNCSEGWGPTGVTEGIDGNFYGTAALGGANGGGTVFELTISMQMITLYNFCTQPNCADGETPATPLIQGSDGNLYGVTKQGGASSNSSVCGTQRCGTIFRISRAGAFASLYSFCSEADCADGYAPTALMQATNGNFYGTTAIGGASPNCGYGETCGTVFSLDVSLGPFVETNPSSGKVGRSISIFGNGLSGTSAVSFNGTPASTFTVASDTLIKATVPTGVTSGQLRVTTPGSTLVSNFAFEVIP